MNSAKPIFGLIFSNLKFSLLDCRTKAESLSCDANWLFQSWCVIAQRITTWIWWKIWFSSKVVFKAAASCRTADVASIKRHNRLLSASVLWKPSYVHLHQSVHSWCLYISFQIPLNLTLISPVKNAFQTFHLNLCAPTWQIQTAHQTAHLHNR